MNVAPRPVYGLIEWEHERTPTLIVGCCTDAVHRAAVTLLSAWLHHNGPRFNGDADFLEHWAVPDPSAPAPAIRQWLAALSDSATVPCFSVLADNVVHTDDSTFVLDANARAGSWTSVPESRPPNLPCGHNRPVNPN